MVLGVMIISEVVRVLVLFPVDKETIMYMVMEAMTF